VARAVLGLDTATAAINTVLAEVSDEGVLPVVEARTVDARAHAERLGPQIAEVLARAGLRPSDLVAVVAGIGPGPFTGLRVGLATAAALSQTLAIPAYGVCSLDGIGALTDGPVLVATDARRREVYWAVYDDGRRVAGPAVDAPVIAAKEAQLLGATVAVGEGARRYADQLGLPVRDGWDYPSPHALVELAADRIRAGAPSERLLPLYLRRPDTAEPRPPKPVTPR
jgi:tRNA threonylcarbamoyl adenosine modification protein YeaZ